MRTLVTGASGFAGSLLVPRLQRDGHHVRALGRDPERVRQALARGRPRADIEQVEVLRGDALTGDGLATALENVSVAYYLLHSMERPPVGSPLAGTPFAERESIAAHTFAAAAERAGVRRIVYLGGLTPKWDKHVGAHERLTTPVSRHLASRAGVERILLERIPDSIALRASIVIGARSRSFRLLVHLVERMPVLTLPAWRSFRTQPIDERDVTDMLAAAAHAPLGGRSLEVGGPDLLTYEQITNAIAELMIVSRPVLRFGVNLTAFTARVAAAVAGEDPELVLPLMEGLQGDLLPSGDHAAQLLGVQLHSFEAAVEHALSDWERSEPLAAR